MHNESDAKLMHARFPAALDNALVRKDADFRDSVAGAHHSEAMPLGT
jgi:hypothetical protein